MAILKMVDHIRVDIDCVSRGDGRDCVEYRVYPGKIDSACGEICERVSRR